MRVCTCNSDSEAYGENWQKRFDFKQFLRDISMASWMSIQYRLTKWSWLIKILWTSKQWNYLGSHGGLKPHAAQNIFTLSEIIIDIINISFCSKVKPLSYNTMEIILQKFKGIRHTDNDFYTRTSSCLVQFYSYLNNLSNINIFWSKENKGRSLNAYFNSLTEYYVYFGPLRPIYSMPPPPNNQAFAI